jgi:hypothetical protein
MTGPVGPVHAGLPGARRSVLTGRRVTLRTVLASEWIKLRSLRSTWFSLLGAVVAIFVIAPFDTRSGGVGLDGAFLAQVAVGVLGVLVITGEYSTGMIRSSFTAVPRRAPILVAKAGVFAAVVFVVVLAADYPAFLFGAAARANRAHATLQTPGAQRAIFAAAVYLMVLGLLAVGLGFLIRSTAGAIATVFCIVYAAPMLALTLHYPTSVEVGRYLPFNTLTQAITTTKGLDSDYFSPWQGIAVTGVWALVALVGGLSSVLRRSA